MIALPAGVLMLCLSLAPGAFAQTQTQPDNSGTNKTQNGTLTADQQTNATTDRQMTAKIRRAIVADKSLSTYGHNVKIVVSGGAVTLKGPVHSDAEKQSIGNTAANIAGADKVSNQLTVKQ